jgi:CRISPR/Cas system-associated protein Cas10 (large subunit of type III CRISPR-Cas system)
MGKQCSVCGIIKTNDDFYKSQRGTKCKVCVLNVTREYKKQKRKDSNFRKKESVKQKERRVRLWQNTLIHDSKRGKEHSLTVNDINEMFENQNGLCYWFKTPLLPSSKSKHPQQPSLDRLDRNKGYTKDNVVLTCYSANIGRNENDLETWETFIKLFIKS